MKQNNIKFEGTKKECRLVQKKEKSLQEHGVKIIGITGGVGSGKSEVLAYLETYPAIEVVELDKIAHQLQVVGTPTYERIVESFGSEILNQDQTINRKILGGLVFQDQKKLNGLNEIIHPAVKDCVIQLIKTTKKEVLVLESAILIETGYDSICQEIWGVFVAPSIRIERLKKQRGYSKEKCLEIMKNQKTKREYEIDCDYLIENNGTLKQMKKHIEKIINNSVQRNIGDTNENM